MDKNLIWKDILSNVSVTQISRIVRGVSYDIPK